MKEFVKVTNQQAKRVQELYDGCDKFYHADVIKSVLSALDIDYYFDTIERTVVLETVDNSPKLTPEQILKDLIENTFNGEKDLYDIGYRYGAWDALRIHAIKYDWLDQME